MNAYAFKYMPKGNHIWFNITTLLEGEWRHGHKEKNEEIKETDIERTPWCGNREKHGDDMEVYVLNLQLIEP